MSMHWYTRTPSVKAMRFAAAVTLSGLGMVAAAQDLSPTPQHQIVTPKVEIFGGYSYFYPHAAVTGTLPGGVLPVSSCLCAIPGGVGASITYNLNSWVGLTADFSGHWASHSTVLSQQIGQSSFLNASFGPKFTYRKPHFAPFGEALVGVNRLSPYLFAPDSRVGFLVGGGVDVPIGNHFSIRPVQADYVISNHQFGTAPGVASTNVRGLRLQAGVVFAFGGRPRPLAAAAPLAAPAQPVAPIAAPITAPAVIAAPTVVCSAMPSMMNVGENSTITAVGSGAGPLTYNFKTDTGVIAGTNDTAILSTAGTRPGTVLVTCTVADATGQTASATTTVTTAALAKRDVAAMDLCSVSFERDIRRPTRVNNEAKACLDAVALTLQRSTDGRLVLVGNAAEREPGRNRTASRRAVNTKAYLVEDKGLDPARISVYSGHQDAKKVSITLVPAGATYDSSGNAPLDETAVKPQPR